MTPSITIGVVEMPSRVGSSFTIYLPAVSEDAGSVLRQDDLDYLPTGSETVLLVEDEPMLRRVAAIVLSDHGYVVLEASNGEEALTLVKENTGAKIDLLLTDVVMPLMGGIPLAERIRSLRPATKVIYMSGYTDEAAILEEGESFFLPKPLSPSALTQKVRIVLDGIHSS